MAMLLRTGTLVISVDLEAGSLASTNAPLARLLGEAGVASTWCVAAPGDWTAAVRLLDAEISPELAILGRDTWTKVSSGRERFAHELKLHLTAAGRAGYRPSSLALTAGNVAGSADLAQKLGITAIRTATPVLPLATGIGALFGRLIGRSSEANRAYRPATVRFGIWDLKPSAVWPHASQQEATRIPAAALVEGLEAAIADQSVFHLAIDAAAIAQAGDVALRGLRKFLVHADRRRRQTRLTIRSMRDLAQRLSSPRSRTAARSILRARAA